MPYNYVLLKVKTRFKLTELKLSKVFICHIHDIKVNCRQNCMPKIIIITKEII